MDHRFKMRVVEIEHVRADAVQQRRMHDVEALAAPQHRRLRRARKFA